MLHVNALQALTGYHTWDSSTVLQAHIPCPDIGQTTLSRVTTQCDTIPGVLPCRVHCMIVSGWIHGFTGSRRHQWQPPSSPCHMCSTTVCAHAFTSPPQPKVCRSAEQAQGNGPTQIANAQSLSDATGACQTHRAASTSHGMAQGCQTSYRVYGTTHVTASGYCSTVRKLSRW